MKLLVDRYCVKRKEEKAEKGALNISEPCSELGAVLMLIGEGNCVGYGADGRCNSGGCQHQVSQLMDRGD
jgi:hypothetical protein